MPTWTGAGAALSSGFMDAFERRRKQAEEEAKRKRQQESLRNMFSSMGLNVPTGEIMPEMAPTVARAGLDEQARFRQEQTMRQQSDAWKAQLKQDYGINLAPNIVLTPDIYNGIVTRVEKARQERERGQGMVNTYNTMMPYAQKLGLNIPDLGGRIPTDDELRFLNDRINDNATFQNQDKLARDAYSRRQGEGAEGATVDVTSSVVLVRGRVNAVQTAEELDALQNDRNFEARLKRIAANDPATYEKILDEIDAKEAMLRGIIKPQQTPTPMPQQTGFNPQGLQNPPIMQGIKSFLSPGKYGSGW